MDCATKQRRCASTTAVEAILRAPGDLVASCPSPTCLSVTRLTIDAGLYEGIRWASVQRLSQALRCTCGARGGDLRPWGSEGGEGLGAHRLYLFQV